jgi:hypothetical protein
MSTRRGNPWRVTSRPTPRRDSLTVYARTAYENSIPTIPTITNDQQRGEARRGPWELYALKITSPARLRRITALSWGDFNTSSDAGSGGAGSGQKQDSEIGAR